MNVIIINLKYKVKNYGDLFLDKVILLFLIFVIKITAHILIWVKITKIIQEFKNKTSKLDILLGLNALK